MMKSGAMKIVGMAAWLITALAAINLGLRPFNYDVFNAGFMARMATPVYYVILAAGIISLVLFFMASTGSCGCPCNGRNTYKM